MKGLPILNHHEMGTAGSNHGDCEVVGENIGIAHLGVKFEGFGVMGT